MEHQTSTILQTITPEEAHNILQNNIVNRPLSKKHVQFLTNEIEKENWKVNGETIKFDEEGKLVDGQHRLHASIAADMPIQTYVIYDVPKDCFPTYDSGKKRTAGDSLHHMGEKNCFLLAAICRWVYIWERNIVLSATIVSNQEIIKTLEEYPEIRESVRIANNNRRKLIPSSVAAFIYFATSKSDKQKAEKFFKMITTGAEIPSGSPVLLLLKKLIENKTNTAKLKSLEICALTIKTWNAYKEDRNIQKLHWSRKEPNKEPFPVII